MIIISINLWEASGRGPLVNTFNLSEEQQHLKDTAARLAEEVYAPRAAEWDRDRAFLPDGERRRLGDLGLLGIALPEEYGGSGAPLLDALIVIEELAKVCRPAAFQVFEANTGPARVVALMGSEEQKRTILPRIASGEATMAVGISEPDAGSAATDMATTAKKIGGEFVINGTKRWISGGGHAEYYLLYARMDDSPGHRGVGAVIVESGTEGLTFGPQERLMGFRGIPSADLVFDDARVPVDNMVVEPGGFRDLFQAFSIERLGNATMSLAIGQAALDRSARYIQERQQFGRPLAEFQNVQTMLADMLIQVESARMLIHRAAANAGTGLPDSLEVSLAKCQANEMAKRVSDMGMQLHGGNGYTEEFDLERLHRDSHGWAIAGGTPSMQRVRIASEMLGRRFSQR